MLISPHNAPEPIRLLTIDKTSMDVLDPNLGHRTIDREHCLVLIRPKQHDPTYTTSNIRLKDGQIFIGGPVHAGDSQAVSWLHPWMGELRIPLELVDSIQLVPSGVSPAAASGREGFDHVRLRNGDVLHGFVVSCADPLEFEIDRVGAKGSEIEIPWGRIASIHFFGKRVPPVLPRAWLNDGTVASFTDIRVGDDWWLQFNEHDLLVPGTRKPGTSPSIDDIHAIALGSTPMVALAELSPTSITSSPTRVAPPPPSATDSSAVLGLSPIELSGPLSVEWSIPAGMNRFQATVRLPGPMQEWGDLEFRLSVDGTLLKEAHLDAKSSSIFMDIPLDGDALLIELREAANGPVQDTIILEYPIFIQLPTSGG